MDDGINNYCADVCQRAMAAANQAMVKYPAPNPTLTKLAEEAGEVVKAGIHLSEGRDYTWEDLEGECIQTIAMCLRLLVEGDGKLGLAPPSRGDR